MPNSPETLAAIDFQTDCLAISLYAKTERSGRKLRPPPAVQVFPDDAVHLHRAPSPDTASGVVFMTLEDETSCGNTLIVTAYCSNSAILQYMKANVTITSRGVITLPAKLRQALGLKAEDHLIAETTPEGLLLRPAVTLPVEMYTPERMREFDAAEQELAAYLGAKAPAVKRAKRKSAR